MSTKQCPNCKEVKPRDTGFYRDGKGCSSWCRICAKARRVEQTSSGYGRVRWAKYVKANPLQPNQKTRRYQLTPIQKMAHQMYDNARKRAYIRGWEFDLTPEWVLAQIVEFCKANYHLFDKFNPFQPSLDRIDGKQSYVKSNVRVTWLIENYARNGFSDDQVIEFCKRKLNLL